MIDAPFTLALEVLLALTLVIAAVIDVRTFTISNRLNLGVALTAPLFWWGTALDLWPNVAVHVAVAVGVFLMLAMLFAAGMMGGGDVKLAAALALWFAPAETLKMLVYTSIAGGVVTLIFLALHKVRRADGRPKIPYGVAIAAGGLMILAQRFLNQFV